MVKYLIRIVAAVLCLLLAICMPMAAFASGGDEEIILTDDLEVIDNTPFEEIPVPTIAQLSQGKFASAVLLDSTTGQIIFEHNSHERRAPASVTKVMVMLLIMEAIDSGKIGYKDIVTVSPHANSMGGSQIWLKVGETMTVDNLMKAIAVNSANDASVAMAEFISGTEEAFVELMNKRASQLGMKDTHFVNATGLDADGHVSSAHDIAIMSRELLKHRDITKYTTIWMDTLRDGKTLLSNTNKLVRFYDGCLGLKTGFTTKAKHCLSAAAKRGDLELIAVVLGGETSDDRFNAVRKMLDYGFANFATAKLEPPAECLKPVKVLHGVQPFATVKNDEIPGVLVAKGTEENIKQSVEITTDVEAPVEMGQILGKVTITLDGEKIGEYNIRASCEVKRMNFINAFARILRALFSL